MRNWDRHTCLNLCVVYKIFLHSHSHLRLCLGSERLKDLLEPQPKLRKEKESPRSLPPVPCLVSKPLCTSEPPTMGTTKETLHRRNRVERENWGIRHPFKESLLKCWNIIEKHAKNKTNKRKPPKTNQIKNPLTNTFFPLAINWGQ